MTVKLPEWIAGLEGKILSPQEGSKLGQALALAIEALEYDTREHSVGFGCAGTQIRASQALARIAALGGKNE